MKPIPTQVLVHFLGEWSVLRECRSIREGRATLKYERARSLWPMKLERR